MQFLPCLRGREAPHNRGLGRIAGLFIGGNLPGQHGFVRDAAIETLALQDTQLIVPNWRISLRILKLLKRRHENASS
jgi:hypothetical protein